jgi:radical SAM protein with 4Fe4S-binding SPASM domain
MGSEQTKLNAYDEFARLVFDNGSAAKRIPLVGSVDITSRCNLKCAHCYATGDSFQGEMSYEEICRIFDQIADAGCFWLLLTGGEPLIRPDFADIYHYAKRKGFLITLFTNGTMITPQLADMLKEEPPFKIEVSLYGMTAATYEKITGVAGSFQRCINGINLLAERGSPLKLKTVAITLNKHEIGDMKKYADNLGVEFRFDPMIFPSLDGSTKPLNLRLSPEEILELDMVDEERCDAFCEICDNLWGAVGDDRLYGCGAGINTFHITANGELAECTLGRRTNYNILQGNFREGFYEVIPKKVLSQKRTRYSECQSCKLASLCGNCPSRAELECGDPEAKVDFLCQVAHLRAAAFKDSWRGKTSPR